MGLLSVARVTEGDGTVSLPYPAGFPYLVCTGGDRFQKAARGKLHCASTFKQLCASVLLTFHWPKQVTWPGPASKWDGTGRGHACRQV